MTKWVRYTLPAAAIVSIASAAYAMQYLSIAEAQKQAFPSATNFSEVQAGRVWKAEAGGRAVGFFIFDRVVGKHLLIDYAVALTPAGAVHSVEILQYRESYGGEIRSRAGWRSLSAKPAAVRSRSTAPFATLPARRSRPPPSPNASNRDCRTMAI